VGRRRLRGWILPRVAVVGLALNPVAASSAVDAAPRRVLGTLSVQGEATVDDSTEGETTAGGVVVTGGTVPVLEHTLIETGDGGQALLDLNSAGQVGLEARARALVVAGPRVELAAGTALVRMTAASPLTVRTPTASVGNDPAAAGRARVEASATVEGDGRTVVCVERGALEVAGQHGQPTVVKAGEEAVVAADGTMLTVAPAPRCRKRTTIFGLNPWLAGAIGVGVVGAGGAGLGGGGHGGGGAPSAGHRQGSPFRMPR